MKTYRRHHCERQHRTVKTFLRCAIPRHHWIAGEGSIALISWCGGPTISLWLDTEAAEDSKGWIDTYKCGHACTGRHEIVRIELD